MVRQDLWCAGAALSAAGGNTILLAKAPFISDQRDPASSKVVLSAVNGLLWLDMYKSRYSFDIMAQTTTVTWACSV